MSIDNDIKIHGHTEEELDACLYHIMESTHKTGFVFSVETYDFKDVRVIFFSFLYDCKGIHSDPAKVNANTGMPAPTSVKVTCEFLGC